VEGTLAHKLYNTEQVHERHRHKYEINNEYREMLQEKGMIISGVSPDGNVVEMVEIPDHPWFIACQFHPEYKSRPNRPHPLIVGFLEAALTYQGKRN
ncbi:MAG: C26 family cysteine hydrolase domain-containing family, partial [Syntrophomonadaceae bacterium]|nr:C26 family cysteine hydrolase domain-containing family [Syntrophomonadaceae bacterium]